jgi:hypothetical protein
MLLGRADEVIEIATLFAAYAHSRFWHTARTSNSALKSDMAQTRHIAPFWQQSISLSPKLIWINALVGKLEQRCFKLPKMS